LPKDGDEDDSKPLPDTKSERANAGSTINSFTDCETCPEIVRILPQNGVLGSPAGESGRESDEPAQHDVKVQQAFALGRYEVTRAQFARFVKATGHQSDDGCFVLSAGRWTKSHARTWRDPGFSQSDDDPVVCVSAKDAEDYAAWLSGLTGKKYRLPNEREWEIAARAGSRQARYWGDDPRDACRHGNGADESGRTRHADWTSAGCDDGFAFTAPVGQFRPNALGLSDMLGNAAEWTSDCWRGYSGQSAGAIDMAASGARDCSRRVVRGGAFNSSPRYLRSASRLKSSMHARIFNLGFRVARELD
jgi:formylglycine-generating enzyme required for sulfatase activity